MSVVSTGLLLARQHAQRAVLFTIPALQYKVSSSPRRILSPLRLYSTHPPHPHPDNAPPAPPQPSREKPKRPPKDLQVARQVVDGVESSKDSVLKAYCLAKVRKNSPKKSNIKEATLDTISFSEYDPDILVSRVFDFDHDMLAHLIATKRKEGWSVSDCAKVVEYIVYDWPLHRCVRFFGHFTRVYVELGESDSSAVEEFSAGDGKVKENVVVAPARSDGKWSSAELGHLVGASMWTREYSFMVDLLVKMIIGDGAHKTLLGSIKDESEGAYWFRGISKFYGVTLIYFPKWEFPFLGTAIRELATVPPQFAKHYYPWYTNELGINFSVDVLVDIAEQRRRAKGDVLLNPRLIGNSLSYIIENWTQEDKDNYKGKLYSKMDGNDNALTYLLYKFARFLKIMKPKKK